MSKKHQICHSPATLHLRCSATYVKENLCFYVIMSKKEQRLQNNSIFRVIRALRVKTIISVRY